MKLCEFGHYCLFSVGHLSGFMYKEAAANPVDWFPKDSLGNNQLHNSSVDWAGPELRDLLAPASTTLELKVCATTT